MADRHVKALTADIECPVIEGTPFNGPRSLRDATVAIVTTSSLHHRDQPDFVGGDTSFRVLDGSRDDLFLGHWSPNFDATGFALDRNVVFPIDRLRELEASGRIGRVASHHLAFAGNQFDLAAVRLDTAPQAADLLRESGVDVVLLTPV